jgi:hypothetical protein
MMIVGSIRNSRIEEQRVQQDQKWSDELLDKRMAAFGYKQVDDPDENWYSKALRGRHYTHCRTENICDVIGHPPVDINFSAVNRVHVWFPTEQGSRLLTICVAGPAAVDTTSVVNDQWAMNIARATEILRPRVVQAMVTRGSGSPVSTTEDGQIVDALDQVELETPTYRIASRLRPVPVVDVNGWRCPVPSGPPPS